MLTRWLSLSSSSTRAIRSCLSRSSLRRRLFSASLRSTCTSLMRVSPAARASSTTSRLARICSLLIICSSTASAFLEEAPGAPPSAAVFFSSTRRARAAFRSSAVCLRPTWSDIEGGKERGGELKGGGTGRCGVDARRAAAVVGLNCVVQHLQIASEQALVSNSLWRDPHRRSNHLVHELAHHYLCTSYRLLVPPCAWCGSTRLVRVAPSAVGLAQVGDETPRRARGAAIGVVGILGGAATRLTIRPNQTTTTLCLHEERRRRRTDIDNHTASHRAPRAATTNVRTRPRRGRGGECARWPCKGVCACLSGESGTPSECDRRLWLPSPCERHSWSLTVCLACMHASAVG